MKKKMINLLEQYRWLRIIFECILVVLLIAFFPLVLIYAMIELNTCQYDLKKPTLQRVGFLIVII